MTHNAENFSRAVFKNISPLDHRYSVSEKAVFDGLSKWLSEDASVAACARAEAALVAAHLKMRGKFNENIKKLLLEAAQKTSPELVYAEEEKTHHNIRALVNVLKPLVPPETAHLVHLGATSVDILDTSLSYRIKNAAEEIILPLLKKLELALCEITEREAATVQIGRTHGQHAVPVTLGFTFAEYVSRLGKSIIKIEKRARGLKGKLAGAVGAYNATSMICADPQELERLYLEELGLEASEHSTQLVEPEYLLRLLVEFNIAFGIIANLADDLRSLQRSEIGELYEGFALSQVGSSTMPQKRNPWNSEHVKSLWKAFMPRAVTFFMDQISEHQRDLTNSASQRFTAEYITGFTFAAARMLAVIEGLRIDREKIRENLHSGKIPGGIMAESAYILLAESGARDAHEIIRRVTLNAEEKQISFSSALALEKEIPRLIENKMRELDLIKAEERAEDFFSTPGRYSGLAEKKALSIALKYKKFFTKPS